jgi:hypothetical protein
LDGSGSLVVSLARIAVGCVSVAPLLAAVLELKKESRGGEL